MNYYQHHIGDFNNATRHLDRIERAIYREMIEMYYDTEQPLSADFKKLCHKLSARREGEPEIVQAILDEFFIKTDQGWVHERCERELESYRHRGDEEDERKKNEKERKRLYRERRKALFAELRLIGVVPKWDTTIEELERLLDQGRAGDADRSGTGAGHPRTETGEDAEETSKDATGTAKPITNNHKPVTINQEPKEIPPIPPKGGRAKISLPAYLELCKAGGKKPIPEDDPVFAYASKAGIPQDFLRLHWLEFKERYALPDSKQYKAWPTVFGKSVRGNWFRLWFIAPDGRCELTTQGHQAKRIHAEAA